MSATNLTPIINLPLFIGTDKPAWLTDWNGAMNIIDSSIAALQTAESGTATSLASLAQSVEALSGTVSQHTTAIQTVTTATATNTGSINTITSLIGNGEPTTTDKTIIGAINEIYSDIGGGAGVDADDVNYDNQTSGLNATDVQAAIDELKDDIDNIQPSSGSKTARGTSSGTTYGQHVVALKTLFNALTDAEKREAYIVGSNNLKYNMCNVLGVFYMFQLATGSQITSDCINLYTEKYLQWDAAGTAGGVDISSTAFGGTFTLYA